jgi:hypothetical protein
MHCLLPFDQEPDVPRRRIIDMRNLIVHRHSCVSADVVQRTIDAPIAELQRACVRAPDRTRPEVPTVRSALKTRRPFELVLWPSQRPQGAAGSSTAWKSRSFGPLGTRGAISSSVVNSEQPEMVGPSHIEMSVCGNRNSEIFQCRQGIRIHLA